MPQPAEIGQLNCLNNKGFYPNYEGQDTALTCLNDRPRH